MVNKNKNEEILHNLYYNEHIFSGTELFNFFVKNKKDITKSFIMNWLKSQAVNQQTRPVLIKKKSGYIPIYGSPGNFQLDLTFMTKYSGDNNGFHIIFTAIEISSRYLYAYKMKRKSDIMSVVMQWFNDLANDNSKIHTLNMDEGSEFTNSNFLKIIEKHNITTFWHKDDSHALGIVNSFHNQLKKYFTKLFIITKKFNWIKYFDKYIVYYNNKVHTSLKIDEKLYSPHQIKFNNLLFLKLDSIRRNLYYDIKEKIESTNIYKINDTVRVRILNKTFRKNSDFPNYTSKIWTIAEVFKNSVRLVGYENLIKKSDLLKIETSENNNENMDVLFAENEKKNSISNKLKKELNNLK
jgi:hypothetical protein